MNDINTFSVAIVGTRGIPASYGGFETFAEELCSRLVSKGLSVSVYCERTPNKLVSYNNIKLYYSKFRKTDNPVAYYFETLKNAVMNNDAVIVTGVGGALFYPFFFHKTRLITNTDGVEHQRNKWSYFKKKFIKISEIFATKFSGTIIADSKGIRAHLTDTYKNISDKIRIIEYGAPIIEDADDTILSKYSLTRNEYYLVVCRLEPENNIEVIVNGFKKSKSPKKLVIIGGLGSSEYAIRMVSHQSDKILFPGSIYDKSELNALRLFCYAYIHGHSVGGTNPSLLEALGCGNIALCHDNQYNREVTESNMLYFRDTQTLSDEINKLESQSDEYTNAKKSYAKMRIMKYYNWDRIADEYFQILTR